MVSHELPRAAMATQKLLLSWIPAAAVVAAMLPLSQANLRAACPSPQLLAAANFSSTVVLSSSGGGGRG